MVIKEILSQLETATHPVAKVLQKGENFKILAIGFKENMILKDHKTPYKSKLLVINGSIKYCEGANEILANQFDEIEIPVNEIHKIIAISHSICLLIQQ